MESKSASDLDESTEQLLQDLKEVVEDGEELLRAGANELSEKQSAARAKLSAALANARETGRKIQERTVAGARATDRVIRDNPYQTLGIAFGAGVLIAILLNRK
ncbi:MAG TPA: DUF883 family protein [Verrucomicrobiae bacterium]|jgi:ElaB/YqjD/DUF883 family membrane-anchored ribosome-binding protein|nr:DUF883 family protein [Verrucomicrobiae bacterium]